MYLKNDVIHDDTWENRQQERRNICYMSSPRVSETNVLWDIRSWIAIVQASRNADPAGPQPDFRDRAFALQEIAGHLIRRNFTTPEDVPGGLGGSAGRGANISALKYNHFREKAEEEKGSYNPLRRSTVLPRVFLTRGNPRSCSSTPPSAAALSLTLTTLFHRPYSLFLVRQIMYLCLLASSRAW